MKAFVSTANVTEVNITATSGCVRTGWDETGVLAAGRVFVRGEPDDVEVRLHVGLDDVVHLEGYRLVPIEPLPPPYN